MRRPHLFVILGLTALAALLPLNTGGCVPGTTGTTDGTGFFNVPPTAVVIMAPDPAKGVVPFAVQFDSSPSSDDGVIVRRQWDFGDGVTSEDISPLHVYRRNGEFKVTLKLTDDRGATGSAEKKVIDLTPEQRNLLLQLVEEAEANIGPEIRHTDDCLYRDDLRAQRRELRAVHEMLKGTIPPDVLNPPLPPSSGLIGTP